MYVQNEWEKISVVKIYSFRPMRKLCKEKRKGEKSEDKSERTEAKRKEG